MPNGALFSIEERVLPGETRWVDIRARGTEWSWLTPEEAATLGRILLATYGHGETVAGEMPSRLRTRAAA